jgi:predicted RNA-binding Zn-ribbon protein involved in translation (DUF1610 family)
MPKCPECGKEIWYLKEHMEAWVVSKLFPSHMEPNKKFEIDEIIPIENLTYDCPECGEELFHDLESARMFVNEA